MKTKFIFLLLIIFSSCILFGCNASEKTVEDVVSEISEIRIKFIVDDEIYETIKYQLGDEFELPEEPKKEGYKFVGWYTRDDEVFDINDIKKNISVYAKFEIDNGETDKTPIGTEEKTPIGTEDITEFSPNYNCSHSNRVAKKIKTKNCCQDYIVYYFCKDCNVNYLDLDNFDVECDLVTKKENVFYDKDGKPVRTVEAYCSNCGLIVQGLIKRDYSSDCVSIETTKYSFYTKDYNVIIEGLYYLDEFKHHNFASYNTEYNSLGNCDIDGYEVIEYCDKCGETNRNISYGHICEYKEEIINTKCGEYIIYGEKCLACGKYSYISTNSSCNFENKYRYDYADGSGYELSEECIECGLTMFIQSIREKYSDCQYLETYMIRIEYAGKVYENIMTRTETSHEFSYEAHDFTGNCDDGFYLIMYCKNCGYSEERTHYGHLYDEQRQIFNGLCNGKEIEFISGGCVTCGYDQYVNVYDNAEWYHDFSNVNYEKYICPNGCCTKEITTNIERITECASNISQRYVYKHKGSLILDETQITSGATHTFNDTFTMYGSTCDEGYDLYRECIHCDFNELLTGCYGHYHIYEENHFEELCPTVFLVKNGCIVCKEGYNEYFYDEDFNWVFVSGDNEHKYFVCKNGCCERYVDLVDTIRDENCNIEYRKSIRLYNNGNLVVEYEDSDYSNVHEYELTYELYGDSCAYGYLEHNRCKYCGQGYTEEKYVHQNKGEFYTFNKPGYCGSEIENNYCFVCGETGFYSVVYDNCNWEYVSETTDGSYCICKTCGAEKYTSYKTLEPNENCTSETHDCYKLIYNGDVLVDLCAVNYYANHDFEHYVENYLGSCDLGYELFYSCKNCGLSSSEYRGGHAYYDKQEAVKAYGYCGSEISYPGSCYACDTYKEAYFNFENCSYLDEYDPINDRWIYTCQMCGAVKTIRQEFVSKNEYCIALYKTVVTIEFNGDILAEFSYISENVYEHDYYVEANYYGYDCYDGVDCTYICKTCGDTYSETRYSHNCQYTSNYFYEDGICGTKITTSYCIICDKVVAIDFEDTCNFYVVYVNEYNGYTEEAQKCDSCGTYKYYYNYTPVVLSDCVSEQKVKVQLFINNYAKYQGNPAFSDEMYLTWKNHEYREDCMFYGDCCEDGVHVTSSCEKCGFVENEYETYSHLMQQNIDVISEMSCYTSALHSTCQRCSHEEEPRISISCNTHVIKQEFYGEDECFIKSECYYCGAIFEHTGKIYVDEIGAVSNGTTKIYVNGELIIEYNENYLLY